MYIYIWRERERDLVEAEFGAGLVVPHALPPSRERPAFGCRVKTKIEFRVWGFKNSGCRS